LPDEKQVTAMLSCMLAGERPDIEPMEIEITRRRDEGLPRTTVSLRTGELNAPLAWLAGYHTAFEKLGGDATFHGAAKLTQVPSRDRGGNAGLEWMLDLSSARIENIDLARMTEFLPHRLAGQASLQLNRCQIVPGGMVDVDGVIQVAGGYISASLLPQLAEDLGCQLTTAVPEDFQFDLIAIDFDLYDGKLAMEGLCNGQRGFEKMPPGTMLCAGGQPIVVTGPQQIAATQLMRLFAAPHSVSVPVFGQTLEMLWLLQPPRGPLTLNDTVGSIPGTPRFGESGHPVNKDPPRISGRISGFQSTAPRNGTPPQRAYW
ncbi:MAG: hypothetical protein CMM00_11975, partial [Rhodopirellula sp.]|nr:hypothetical protein [Rhodopirellula sp.]